MQSGHAEDKGAKGYELPHWQQSPDDLLQLLNVTAALSILAIITISTFGFYQIFRGFVIDSAEEDSVDLCEVMIEEFRPFFFRSETALGMNEAMDRDAYVEMDHRIRHFLKPYQIVKIKVYNANRKIIYSTDSKIIGMVDSTNKRLNNAMAGNIDSKLEKKEKMKDLAEEEIINLDVVETYVPIVNRSGNVQGCFEVYLNVNKYRDQVWRGVLFAMGIMVAVVLSVFSFTYVLIKKGTDRLRIFQRHLGKIAVTDTLTGIINRGYLLERGEEQFHRVRRNREKNMQNANLGCLMIDIDHFKSINDTMGHLVGDRVIKGVASRIRSGLRNYEIVGRYGGEEFVVLLPDTDLEMSRIVAERIWGSIRNESFDVQDDTIRVTVSIGVSSYNVTDTELNDILKRADEALYKAKNDGRDRIEWLASDPVANNQKSAASR